MLPDFLQHFSVPIVQGGYANATQVQVTAVLGLRTYMYSWLGLHGMTGVLLHSIRLSNATYGNVFWDLGTNWVNEI